ncbi:MAG: polyphosphate kinase 1 [Armatimonadetes bacterium]|nr:polyphosphate kinase 1 [Armatimonadota bacterium]
MPRQDRDLLINRELGWLEFNHRVMEEAALEDNPLLERLKFLAIVSSNLDEFFMVRVAVVQQQVSAGVTEKGEGIAPPELLEKLRERCHEMIDEQYRLYREELEPRLRAEGIRLRGPDELSDQQRAAVNRHFAGEVFPVLSPLAIDPGHPVPRIRNLGLNLLVTLQQPWMAAGPPLMAVVEVPGVLKRLVPLPGETGGRDYILLEDVIRPRVGMLFPGFRVQSCAAFRVTRNSDLNFDEEEADDLLAAIEKELRERERGNPVRMEVQAGCDPFGLEFLRRELGLSPADIYTLDGPLNLTDFFPLTGLDGFAHLRDRPFVPPVVPALRESSKDIFETIRRGDILLHHPYDSFSSVVEFVDCAADDPDVLAIKQTLYRTSGDSPIIRALSRAAENGKQVSVLVELKARFDEGNNITWARLLEESGAHVVYGLIGLKTHCKVICVVRRERDGIRRYCHLGTGNYNPATARLYTDIGMFTCRPDLGEDVTHLFNILTGYSEYGEWQKLSVAPRHLKAKLIELIDREAARSTPQRPGRIVAKVNAVIEPKVIEALYRASQAGVSIDLISRGICGLVPGVPGVSETIRVRSIVGRFLEHSRIYYFHNGGDEEVYLASADLMDRNLNRRIETMFPVEDEALKQRLIGEIVRLNLADNVKAWELHSDTTWTRVQRRDGEPPVNCQEQLIQLALSQAPLGEAKLGAGARFLMQRMAHEGGRKRGAG